ncbi:hypothetical protein PIB30_101706, partial [Stylosanthes scabra]|nr:hypothetical protein [Stylosanthes scabra]
MRGKHREGGDTAWPRWREQRPIGGWTREEVSRRSIEGDLREAIYNDRLASATARLESTGVSNDELRREQKRGPEIGASERTMPPKVPSPKNANWATNLSR